MENDILDAPCLYCSYSGEGYWQTGTHKKDCPWRNIGGEKERAEKFRETAAGWWHPRIMFFIEKANEANSLASKNHEENQRLRIALKAIEAVAEGSTKALKAGKPGLGGNFEYIEQLAKKALIDSPE